MLEEKGRYTGVKDEKDIDKPQVLAVGVIFLLLQNHSKTDKLGGGGPTYYNVFYSYDFIWS